jgi:hypothetical protein
MLPTCVHVTLQDEIFVGIVDSDSKNMDSGSRRTILKLTCEGIKKADLEFDSRGVRLFTVPYRCCVNEVTKDIVVIDKHNAFTGRIIGTTNISSCNVTCTQVGNIGEKSLTFRKIPTFDKVCSDLFLKSLIYNKLPSTDVEKS